MKSAVRFGLVTSNFMLDKIDGLNQSVLVTGLQKANKIFQPNLGSGQTSQSDLDFNKGKRPVINKVANLIDVHGHSNSVQSSPPVTNLSSFSGRT